MTISRALNQFLRSNAFKQQIVRGYERFEILSEAGLRSVVAGLISAKLQKLREPAKRYRVSCETRVGNVIPDILIWKGKHPRFWIELKDTRLLNRASAQSDWDKLEKCLELHRSINGGFLIYVARRQRQQPVEFHIKRNMKIRRLWPILIVLEDEMGDGFEVWNTTYKSRAHYPGR